MKRAASHRHADGLALFYALTAHISLCQTQTLRTGAISFAAVLLWQYQEKSGNKLNALTQRCNAVRIYC